MLSIKFGWTATLVAAALGALVSPIRAATVSPTKSNGKFIAGTGIPADNFTIDTATSGESVALKGRLRDTGQALNIIGNKYLVPTGNSTTSPSSPAWVFDWQFSPGTSGMSADMYYMTLSVDFDPDEGSTDFATLAAVIGDGDADPANSWDDGDGFFTNPGGGGWSDDNVPFVYSQSWHLGFTFWTAAPFNKSYDPDVRGEYEIQLEVSKMSDFSDPIASTSILVNVVPEPASLVLLGLAGASAVGLRRRRRNRT